MLRNRLHRLAGSGGSLSLPNLRKKASNACSAVQDTYLSTKDIFERHRVVFTVSTSIASVLTAWVGYSLRYHHQEKVEKRLESIEQAMRNSYDLEQQEIKKIVNDGSISTTACLATAGTTLVIGYVLGWRGGAWYAKRKIRREQLKSLGHSKPTKWQFLRRPSLRTRLFAASHKSRETANPLTGSVNAFPTKSNAVTPASLQIPQ